MKRNTLWLWGLSLFASLAIACSTVEPPEDALQSAADAVKNLSTGEEECAAQTYALAKKALLEAQAAAEAGDHALARQKALTAQSLAKQAKEEAQLNAEECERLRNTKNIIEEKLQEPEEVYETVAYEVDEQFRVIYFDFDESVLSSRSSQDITFNVQILKSQPQRNVRLASHTDERGTSEYNLALSQKRGESVKHYATSLGIESSRLTVVPYGKEMPVVYGTREQDYALNRRVEFISH